MTVSKRCAFLICFILKFLTQSTLIIHLFVYFFMSSRRTFKTFNKIPQDVLYFDWLCQQITLLTRGSDKKIETNELILISLAADSNYILYFNVRKFPAAQWISVSTKKVRSDWKQCYMYGFVSVIA